MKFLSCLSSGKLKNLVEHHISREESADTVEIPDELASWIRTCLSGQGIESLYCHQRQAYDQIRTGRNVVIATGVASGKSLCYQLPILQKFHEDVDSTALLMFPTKALTQDQKNGFARFSESCSDDFPGLSLGIYDGDTPGDQKRKVRDNAGLVFTNPDMLHMGILPHHTKWSRFFTRLKFIVIDEVHIYRGVFGSHFANVIRRLRRICRFYRSDPSYILTSATLGNTGDFINDLCEMDFEIIERDCSPHGERHFLIYNPPLVDRELGLRRSYLKETVDLASELNKLPGQGLIFAHTRRMVEFVLNYLRERLPDKYLIHGYRGGYLPAERRRIEKDIRSGRIKYTIATNAMELGVDIGGLDLIIINGYPGSIASLRQQAGRAGRRGKPALIILVLSSDLIDQFLARNPDYIFGNDPEAALINPDNPFILLHHLKCALFELPFSNRESFGKMSPSELSPYLDLLLQSGLAYQEEGSSYWLSDRYPASEVSLRTIGSGEFVLQDQGRTIGLVDENSAYWMTHPGAIYLHDGESYYVKDLDLEEHRVKLEAAETDYYTQALSETGFILQELEKKENVKGGRKYFGELKVIRQVIGFKKIKWNTQEILGFEELDLPSTEMVTRGYWIGLDREIPERLKHDHSWNNEPNVYGKKWKEISAAVKARDGFKCSACGMSNETVKLHVHHREPFRKFFDRDIANRQKNLITLCPSCHRKAERSQYVQSGLAGLSYLLGHIAPVFLMCDLHDIRVYQEGKSELASGRPALVFYDAVPGGVGLSEKLYSIHDEILKSAQETALNCLCRSGCPACVGPVAERGAGSKELVIAILREITDAGS